MRLYIFVLVVLLGLPLVNGRTKADERKKRTGGDFKILKGAFYGDKDLIHEGLNGGGSIDTVLSKDIGENNFKLGKAHHNFPVAPAIHVAISGGTFPHLRTVHTMLLAGANINLYYYEKRKDSRPIPVYHPAIYYGVGAFGTPNSGHAGLLQSLFVSYPDKYNHSRVKEWVHITGTPPPLHVAIMRSYFDGAYLLATMPSYDINMKDVQGLVALHVATWLGNSELVALLIHNGADIFATDKHNRTFLHYVALRGIHSIAERMITNRSAIPHEMKLELLNRKDYDNRTALDLALLPPAQMKVVASLKNFIENATQSIVVTNNGMPADKTQSTAEAIHPSRKNSEISTGWISSSCASLLAVATHWGNVTALSSRKVWSAVPTVDSKNTSSGPRFLDFYNTQRPLLMNGNVTGSMDYWRYGSWSRDAFLRAYGGLDLNVSGMCGPEELAAGQCFGGVEQSTSLRDYLRRGYREDDCMKRAENTCSIDDEGECRDRMNSCCEALPEQQSIGTSFLPSYMIDTDFTIWKAVDPFQVCFKKYLPGNIQLRAAVGRIISTPLTSASAAWNVLLVGEVRHWYLISPGAALIAIDEDILHGNMHPQEWVRSVFVKLRRRRLAVEIVQRTGDVVYIPHGWHHVTISAGEVVDLTNQFCTMPGNLTVFDQIPTGIRVYGSRANL